MLPHFVVEITHVLSGMPHPELVNALWTVGVVSKEGVPESTKRMMPRFACSGEWIQVFQFFSAGCRCRRTMHDCPRGLPCRVLNKNPPVRLPVSFFSSAATSGCKSISRRPLTVLRRFSTLPLRTFCLTNALSGSNPQFGQVVNADRPTSPVATRPA